jgi:hypothetical protein
VNLNSFKNEINTYLVELFLQGSDNLFTAWRLQSWSPQHAYDTRQDNTTDYLTFIPS